MEYKIKLTNNICECDIGKIAFNNWSSEYTPETFFRMCYAKERGMVIRMECLESDPFTRYTKNYDPVYTDSCMECFFNLFPEKSDNYINLETNSNGAFIFSYGAGRGDRIHILPKHGISPEVTITKNEDRWIADIIIGNDALSAVYGDFEIKSGHVFRGNLYKCAQDFKEHYISWSPITTPKPDFHCPPYFGVFTVE